MAMAAGAEAGPIFTAKSKANVSLAGGILVMSIGITIFYIPFMLGLLLPDVHFDVGHLASEADPYNSGAGASRPVHYISL
jgi:predicted Na+-dependent transporter